MRLRGKSLGKRNYTLVFNLGYIAIHLRTRKYVLGL